MGIITEACYTVITFGFLEFDFLDMANRLVAKMGYSSRGNNALDCVLISQRGNYFLKF